MIIQNLLKSQIHDLFHLYNDLDLHGKILNFKFVFFVRNILYYFNYYICINEKDRGSEILINSKL